jgi:YD repeat-containing protein
MCNDADRLTGMTAPNGDVTSFTLDALGRIWTSTTSSVTTTRLPSGAISART